MIRKIAKIKSIRFFPPEGEAIHLRVGGKFLHTDKHIGCINQSNLDEYSFYTQDFLDYPNSSQEAERLIGKINGLPMICEYETIEIEFPGVSLASEVVKNSDKAVAE